MQFHDEKKAFDTKIAPKKRPKRRFFSAGLDFRSVPPLEDVFARAEKASYMYLASKGTPRKTP